MRSNYSEGIRIIREFQDANTTTGETKFMDENGHIWRTVPENANDGMTQRYGEIKGNRIYLRP